MTPAPNFAEIATRLLPCDGTFRCVHHLHFIRCPAYSRDDFIIALRQVWNAAIDMSVNVINTLERVEAISTVTRKRILALRIPEEP